jgi:hypothetical protein
VAYSSAKPRRRSASSAVAGETPIPAVSRFLSAGLAAAREVLR